MDKIYLAKLYDRHVDDTFVAFKSLDNAIAQCEKWVEEYGDRYEWNIPTWNWQEYWKYFKETFEDGPTVSVQEIELF